MGLLAAPSLKTRGKECVFCTVKKGLRPRTDRPRADSMVLGRLKLRLWNWFLYTSFRKEHPNATGVCCGFGGLAAALSARFLFSPHLTARPHLRRTRTRTRGHVRSRRHTLLEGQQTADLAGFAPAAKRGLDLREHAFLPARTYDEVLVISREAVR